MVYKPGSGFDIEFYCKGLGLPLVLTSLSGFCGMAVPSFPERKIALPVDYTFFEIVFSQRKPIF